MSKERKFIKLFFEFFNQIFLIAKLRKDVAIRENVEIGDFSYVNGY